MRFLITPTVVKGPSHVETAFDEKYFDAMMKLNEDMAKAGVLIASEGLNPASTSAHVRIEKGKKSASLDGPFAETKELIGGFWILRVNSREEAVEWAMKYPPGPSELEVLEIRQLTDEGDLPPELVARVRKIAPTWAATWK